MNELELIVDEAERRGLVSLDDIVDYAILHSPDLANVTRSIVKTKFYHILREKDRNKPSLADMVTS